MVRALADLWDYLSWVCIYNDGAANIFAISRQTLYASVDSSIATSAYVKLWPSATARTTLTVCTSPKGNPPIVADFVAGSSLPHTV